MNVIWMVRATPFNNQMLSFVITLEVICFPLSGGGAHIHGEETIEL
jgi:hypothetical protein